MKHVSILALVFLLIPVFAFGQEATFPQVMTQEEARAKYTAAGQGGEKVRILIMPGHEPSFGGTELGPLKERDLMVDLSNQLATHLATDSRIEVVVARDTQSWLPDLEEYFDREWRSIERFVDNKRRDMQRSLRRGQIEERTFEVAHNRAATDVALRLYGINKWANEEGFDLVIHPHFNDNPGASNHSGFAVYVPDRQYGNAAASFALGTAIANELNQFNATSTLPIENYGVVEDQSLIAIGAFNTAEFPVALIEYAYIYETKIANDAARPPVLADFAYQTYRGIREYLGAPVAGNNTLALPRVWEQSELPLRSAGSQVYALQVALSKLGFYPPAGDLLIGCPISGFVGECTKRAVRAFQASKGLEQTGTIGPRTKAALEAAVF